MSKVKIQGNASGTGTLTISAPNTDTDRSITLPDGAGEILTNAEGSVESAITTQLSHRNLVINGAMQVAQRGTSQTGVTGASYTTVDRFRTDANSLGTWTMTQSTDAPNGFSHSFKMDCTTSGTPSTAGKLRFQYKLEGDDVQHLAYGTSDAKSLTFSCWVKSNKTGNAVFNIYNLNSTQNRQSVHLLTINTADTWEYKTITISGDTSYAIETGNGQELYFDIWLNGGSNYTSGTRDGTYVNLSASNQYVDGTLDLGESTSDYIAFTGVQLEVGSVATPFEHRSYGEELARCQRYYQKIGGGSNNLPLFPAFKWGGNSAFFTLNLPVNMRTAPTIGSPAGTSLGNFRGNSSNESFDFSDLTSENSSTITPLLTISLTLNPTSDITYIVYIAENKTLTLDAEL